MEKAKVNEFSGMTLEEAQKLPLDGKKNDKGEFTSLSLKRGLVIDDNKKYIERRVFKNADMTNVVVYDLELPLTMDDAETLFGPATCLDYIWSAARVDKDAEKAGKGKKEKSPEELTSDLFTSMRKLGKSEEDIKKAERQLKACGFLK